VVLVDRDAVEAELVGADQRAQVAVVELVSPDCIEELVRIVDHRGRVLLVIVRDVDVVVVVEGVQLDVFEGAQPRHTSSVRDCRRAVSRSGVRLRTRVREVEAYERRQPSVN